MLRYFYLLLLSIVYAIAYGQDEIGRSANLYGNAYGVKTAFVHNPDLNSFLFTYRNDPATHTGTSSSGIIRSSVSFDKGQNWISNHSIMWDQQSGGAARYPQACILNPVGNTDPQNAIKMNINRTLNTANNGFAGIGISWQSLTDSSVSSNQIEILDSNMTFQGDVTSFMNKAFLVEPMIVFVSGSPLIYLDSLAILKFEYQNAQLSTNRTNIYFPANMIYYFPDDLKVSFSPDGKTGFICAVGRYDTIASPEPRLNLLYSYSTDSGNTWSAMNEFDIISDLDTAILNNLQDTSIYFYPVIASPFPSLDLIVDSFGNPHLIMAIDWRPDENYANGINNPRITHEGGTTIWHVYSKNKGLSWQANKLADTSKKIGNLGELTNQVNHWITNRPQISRDRYGNFLVFTWSDTDTLTWPNLTDCTFYLQGPCGNIRRNIHYRALRINDSTYTDEVDNQIMFHSFVHYNELIPEIILRDNNGLTIPMVYSTIAGTDPATQTTHYYASGGFIDYSDFLTGRLSQKETFELIKIYPNPATDKLMVDYQNLPEEPETIRIEISDMLGRKIESLITINEERALDISDFNPGSYILSFLINKHTFRKKLIKR